MIRNPISGVSTTNDSTTKRRKPLLYRFIRRAVQIIYPKISVEGAEHLPEDGCILVGNHCHMHGPITSELYVPGRHTTWCAAQMMELKEVPPYAYQDFWSGKPKAFRWFYRLLSYLIAPLSVLIFNHAYTIPVYHDQRLITTMKQTVAELEAGSRVMIFPECYEPHNQIVYQFQDRFIDVAKHYYKRTGKIVSFVPTYVAPNLKKMFFGEPVAYDPAQPIAAERVRIAAAMMDGVTALAESQPEHVVVPYPNMSSKHYVTSKGRPAARQPERDYRKLRPGNLTSPEYRHLLLLLGWIVYFIAYFLTENLIPPERCHPIHSALDDLIPFHELFVIPYTFWYVLIVISLLRFLLYEVDSFRNLQKFIIITQLVAVIVYVLYPSRQDLRPDHFTRDNLLTRIMGFIYAFDTSTGVCPSLHVAYSLGIASVWAKSKLAKPGTKVLICLLCGLISISVCFVKQHSIVDVFAAIPLGMLAELLVFGRSWYWPRLKRLARRA